MRGVLNRQGAVTTHSEEHRCPTAPSFQWNTHLSTHTAFNGRKTAAASVLGKQNNLPKNPVISAIRLFSQPQRQAALSRNKDKEERLTGFYFLIKTSSVPCLHQWSIKRPVKITSPVSILNPVVSLEAAITLPPASKPGEPSSRLLGVLFQLWQFLCHGQLPAPGVRPLFLKQGQRNETPCACRRVEGTLHH